MTSRAIDTSLPMTIGPFDALGVLLILEFDAAQPRDTIPAGLPEENVVTRSVAWMPPGITCTVSLIEQYRPILTGGSC